VGTVCAAQPQETVGQNATFEKGIKLLLDELRKTCASCRLHLDKELSGMLLHEAILGAPFRAVALVMNPGRATRLDWLLTKGLQAMLQRVDVWSIP
jgi:hypothetical protein